MSTQPWKFLINTFYSQTVDSIKNALSLTIDHLAKLTANEADAEILAIKTAYLPIHDAFITAYNQLQSKLGLYHGKTQTFEEMLEELAKEKINEWRGQVFAVFPEGTPNATAIFPQDRQPFQQGTRDQRVEAVHTLATTLATYTTQATLVALSAVVSAYYITLTGARALQQTDEGSVETLRTNLKAAHLIMCTGLYRNLGKLMAKYAETPETVANYYDLTLLRDTGSTTDVEVEGDVPTGVGVHNIQLGTFGPTSQSMVELIVTGEAIDLYASSAPNTPPAGTVYHVPVGTTTITLAQFAALVGFSDTNTKLNVMNNGILPAHYKITFKNVTT